MTVSSFLLPRFLATVLVFLCMCQRTLSGQALEEKRIAVNQPIPWIPLSWWLDSAERDLDDSSFSGYPTDTSLPSPDEISCSPPIEIKKKFPAPAVPIRRNPITLAGEQRERATHTLWDWSVVPKNTKHQPQRSSDSEHWAFTSIRWCAYFMYDYTWSITSSTRCSRCRLGTFFSRRRKA